MNAYGNPRAAPASFRRWPGCLLDRPRSLSIVIGRSLYVHPTPLFLYPWCLTANSRFCLRYRLRVSLDKEYYVTFVAIF